MAIRAVRDAAQLRREKDKLTETITTWTAAKVIADEEKVAAAQEKLIADEAKVEAAHEKVIADKAKALAAREKVIADRAKALAARKKVIADEEKVAAAHEKLLADEAKDEAAHEKVIAEKAKALAAHEKVIAEKAKALAAREKAIADRAKALAARKKVIADEATALAARKKVIADEAKALAARKKVIADEAKALAVKAKVVADEEKAVAAREKVVADEAKVVADKAKTLAARKKVIADEAKALAVKAKVFADEEKAVAAREKVVADEDKRVAARLHNHDRTWSDSFQEAVRPPRLPIVPGYAFDAVYEPGANDAQVGGDWYDAVRLTDGRMLISIGDVAGSGLESAVIMGVVRQMLRGIAQVHPDPAFMLDAADRALRLEHEDAYVTAWIGVIDVVARTVTWASAGHPPALLGYPDGTVHELGDGSLPLGLRHGSSLSTTTMLPESSTLVLYTDGLTEATHDILAGTRLVLDATSTIATAPWLNPASEIHQGVLTNGSTDDVAILVVRMNFAEAERHIYRSTFDAQNPSAAVAARRSFVAMLTARKFGGIALFNAELIFGELVSNVLRHSPAMTDVEVAVDTSGTHIVLHVMDRGPGFSFSSRLPNDLYSECGRGLYLVASLTDGLTVTARRDCGSHARAVLVGHAWTSFHYDALPISVEPLPLREPCHTSQIAR